MEPTPSRRGTRRALDKTPWTGVVPPEGPVEAAFVCPVLLGESIAPFRLLTAPLCVMPVQGEAILDSRRAAAEGFRYLAAWLRDTETKWLAHCAKQADGTPRMTLGQRLDHMRGLSAQLPTPGTRVVYAKAGTLFAAATLTDVEIVVDHMAYWAATRSPAEARYLCAVLNSETARLRIAPMQPKGQGGARHFDNLIWELRIPEYDRREALHRELAAAAAIAERVAAAAALPEGAHFTRQRRAVRDALNAHGIAGRIDALVARLLDG